MNEQACWSYPWQLTDPFQLDALDTFETIKIAIAYKVDGDFSLCGQMLVNRKALIVAGTGS